MAPSALKRRKGTLNRLATARTLCLFVILVLFLVAIFLFLLAGFVLSVQEHAERQLARLQKSASLPDRRKDRRIGNGIKSHSTQNETPSAPRKTPANFPPKFPVISEENAQVSEDVLEMCGRTIWHTLETTTIVLPDEETFIYTGDIDDLWLRDSAAQVHPYLVPFGGVGGKSLVQTDARLARVVAGLIKRTSTYIRHDPYANAFRIDDSYHFSAAQKKLGRHDLISTWNYELDSACYYMRMLYYFYKAHPDHAVLKLQSVKEAIHIMVDVWISEQDHENDAFPTGDLFDCVNCNKPYRYPGLARDGKGTKTARIGMTWTGFRPSDDECQYGYLVPANMMAVVVLRYMAEMATKLWNDSFLTSKATKLANEIQDGIEKHAIYEHKSHGKIYAYEVDGLGHVNLMDDANVPSLMSIPYLGYDYDPEIYANTRRFILSHSNPTYAEGTNKLTGPIKGYGSPHMKQRIQQNIWPMALAVQGLTSASLEEKVKLAEQLVKATADTGWMHESFDVSNPKRFTRDWFCWADALFAELVMSMTNECPKEDAPYKIMEWRDPVKVLR